MAAPLPAHPDCRIESAEPVWQGRFPLWRVRFRQRRFDGALSGPREWELWRRGRAVGVLPYDPRADCVLLVEQFRLPVLAAGFDPISLEIPAGLLDGAEAPEAAARRELAEEAGLAVGRLLPIGDYVLSPGGSDERVAIFLGEMAAPPADAAGLAGFGGLAAEGEDIRLRLLPAAQAIDRALEGGIGNAVTAIALLWLAARREWLRTQWSTHA